MDLNNLVIPELPELPGIYIFKNTKNETLYVGKAKNIKKILKSYFTKSRDSRINISFLMKEAASLDFVTTNNEEEALMLESKTIKIRQPKFNILLKDDKTYASLRIEMKNDFPRISKVRKCNDKNSIYLGPFKSADSLNKTKRLFQKVFGIRDCSDNKFKMHNKRACIYKNIGLCLGPCDEVSLKSSYDKNIGLINKIFSGKIGELKKHIQSKMNESSNAEKYEEASFYRDELELISNNYYFNPSSSIKLENTDILGFCKIKNKIQIIILFFRGGYLIDKADLYIEAKSKHVEMNVYQAVSQFYAQGTSVPERILMKPDFSYLKQLQNDLIDFSFSNTTILPCKNKDGLNLIELANENAQNYIRQNLKEELETLTKLKDIKSVLKLKNMPNRIECFDISNTQGTNPVASMVTFIDGVPSKDFYRKFKMHTRGPNDYAMMEEAISRRIKRIGQSGWEKPDLILIDGGKGHLNKIVSLKANNISFASIAKPKSEEHIDKIYIPGSSKPVNFENKIPALNILINARNEAHRFAITFHKKKRQESMFTSILDKVPGISSAAKQRLLEKFGDIKGIKRATFEELKESGLSQRIILNLKSNLKDGQV